MESRRPVADYGKRVSLSSESEVRRGATTVAMLPAAMNFHTPQ